MRELGAALQRDIFTESPCVRWGDISGLDTAKRLLGEAVVAPIRYPELFTGGLGQGFVLRCGKSESLTFVAELWGAAPWGSVFCNLLPSTIIMHRQPKVLVLRSSETSVVPACFPFSRVSTKVYTW